MQKHSASEPPLMGRIQYHLNSSRGECWPTLAATRHCMILHTPNHRVRNFVLLQKCLCLPYFCELCEQPCLAKMRYIYIYIAIINPWCACAARIIVVVLCVCVCVCVCPLISAASHIGITQQRYQLVHSNTAIVLNFSDFP